MASAIISVVLVAFFRLFTRVRTYFRTDDFFSCAIRLRGTVQVLLQIAVLFAFQKLTRFCGSRVNERRIRASCCPLRQKFVRTRVNGVLRCC